MIKFAFWWWGGMYCILSFLPLFALPFQNSDTLKILAIRVEFQQDDAGTTTGDGKFDLTNSTAPFQIDPPPHNRSYFQDHLLFAQNYFKKASRGLLVIESEVFPQGESEAYQLDLPMTEYNPNTSSEAINEGLARLLRDALQKADDDPAIDFSKYNTFIVFHAGVGRDIDLGIDSTPQDIPSLFINQNFLQENLSLDGISVDGGATVVRNGIVLPETESQEGIQLGLNGMLISNLGSQLGFLDLFSPETRKTGVGRFALMDAGLFNGDGLLPAFPMAWTRIEAGWERPITVFQAQNDEFTIRRVLSSPAAQVYIVPINEKEYFLLENRFAGKERLDSLQFVLSENRTELASMREVLETFFPNAATFSATTGVLTDIDNPDRGLPGSGVLIWHIDENIIDANRATNRINNDPDHRGIDLEEADGSQDIGAEFDIISGGSGSELGTALDPWYRGNNAPLFKNEFSLTSIPNSRSNVNNANSHITIKNFSGRDSVMTFEMSLDIFQPEFPVAFNTDVLGSATSMKTVDLDGNGSSEIILTTNQNNVLVFDETGKLIWPGRPQAIALELPDNISLITPPAFFKLPGSETAMAILSREGSAFFFRFNRAENRIDSLFQAECPAEITTFPIAVGNDAIVSFGCANGSVFQVLFDGQTPAINILTSIPEAVKYLHFTRAGDAVIVGASGKVYDKNAAQIAEAPATIFQPAGENAVTATADGAFFDLTNPALNSAELGVFRIDAPLIALNFSDQSVKTGQSLYLTNGDNRILVFNDNFTLRNDFPLNLYNPSQTTKLFISPLSADLPGGETQGDVIVVDPAGMISAFDLNGNLLPDFPLAAGDSIIVSPALLDIDADGDLELASVTVSGTIYVWDFSPNAAQSTATHWSQLYASPGNTNLPGENIAVNDLQAEGLLPEQFVYNWPNPNIDNFTFIRYRLNESADVRIKIFDLAGDLVKELSGPGVANHDNEVRWDLTGVQSGVYLGRVEASGSGKSDVQVIKIAVVK